MLDYYKIGKCFCRFLLFFMLLSHYSHLVTSYKVHLSSCPQPWLFWMSSHWVTAIPGELCPLSSNIYGVSHVLSWLSWLSHTSNFWILLQVAIGVFIPTRSKWSCTSHSSNNFVKSKRICSYLRITKGFKAECGYLKVIKFMNLQRPTTPKYLNNCNSQFSATLQ